VLQGRHDTNYLLDFLIPTRVTTMEEFIAPWSRVAVPVLTAYPGQGLLNGRRAYIQTVPAQAYTETCRTALGLQAQLIGQSSARLSQAGLRDVVPGACRRSTSSLGPGF